MSSLRFTAGLRVNIRHLEGASVEEALQYFRTVLGEPDDIDEYDDDDTHFVDSFRYKDYYNVNETDDIWTVDYVINKSSDYEGDFSFCENLHSLNNIIEDLKYKFNVTNKDIAIFSHLWDDGVEEPIEWKD